MGNFIGTLFLLAISTLVSGTEFPRMSVASQFEFFLPTFNVIAMITIPTVIGALHIRAV